MELFNNSAKLKLFKLPTIKTTLNWILRIVPAFILLQTLFFKFSAAPESVYIFTVLGIEPWGRIGIGVMELIVAILILIPKTSWAGFWGAIGLMIGAIYSHLMILGIEVNQDNGTLFILALVVLVTSLIGLIRQKQYFMSFVKVLAGK